jgi:hypothetical protein
LEANFSREVAETPSGLVASHTQFEGTFGPAVIATGERAGVEISGEIGIAGVE